ncbi:MAG: polyprenol monophosphomannose synthase, partial [Fidelibacterota bacterium]
MRNLIIIPTYNEAENIEKLLIDLFALDLDIEILVVDDNSPDGTAQLVRELMKRYKGLFLLQRDKKRGLGTAYLAGFKFALKKDYEHIFEMDADLSHDPEEIPNFLREVEKNDLIIGSRYCDGVSVIHWPIRRLILSYGANLYTRIVTGLPLKDCTSGFKCFKRKVLESIDLNNVHSGGYSFQIEMNFRAWKKGFTLKEIPIIFEDRTVGKSKMSKK